MNLSQLISQNHANKYVCKSLLLRAKENTFWHTLLLGLVGDLLMCACAQLLKLHAINSWDENIQEKFKKKMCKETNMPVH